jgi:hypothetical protein
MVKYSCLKQRNGLNEIMFLTFSQHTKKQINRDQKHMFVNNYKVEGIRWKRLTKSAKGSQGSFLMLPFQASNYFL